MAESPEDKDVDALIADLKATIAKLETAQRKDVQEDAAEEDKETPASEQPKTLQEANVRVRAHFRKLRGQKPA